MKTLTRIQFPQTLQVSKLTKAKVLRISIHIDLIFLRKKSLHIPFDHQLLVARMLRYCEMENQLMCKNLALQLTDKEPMLSNQKIGTERMLQQVPSLLSVALQYACFSISQENNFISEKKFFKTLC